MKLVMMTLEAAENSWLKLRRQVQTVLSIRSEIFYFPQQQMYHTKSQFPCLHFNNFLVLTLFFLLLFLIYMNMYVGNLLVISPSYSISMIPGSFNTCRKQKENQNQENFPAVQGCQKVFKQQADNEQQAVLELAPEAQVLKGRGIQGHFGILESQKWHFQGFPRGIFHHGRHVVS